MCARAGVRSGLRFGSLRGRWGSLGFPLGSFGFDLGSHFQQSKPATRSQEFERGNIRRRKFGARSPTSSPLVVKFEITSSKAIARKYKLLSKGWTVQVESKSLEPKDRKYKFFKLYVVDHFWALQLHSTSSVVKLMYRRCSNSGP